MFPWKLKEVLVMGKSHDILPLNILRFGAFVADRAPFQVFSEMCGWKDVLEDLGSLGGQHGPRKPEVTTVLGQPLVMRCGPPGTPDIFPGSCSTTSAWWKEKENPVFVLQNRVQSYALSFPFLI